MRIHQEGYRILAGLAVGGACIQMAVWRMVSVRGRWQWLVALGGLWGAVAAFFRVPNRPAVGPGLVAPADGLVVKVEQVYEGEYLEAECWQVSIFLSVFNVHVNWVPLDGQVVYRAYHPGAYVLAFHPKSSQLNEHSSVVIQSDEGQAVLVRQIAGFVARRISTYPQTGQLVRRGEELGFIKFGSRVDVFLPLDSQVRVQTGQMVRGLQTVLATWPGVKWE